MLAVHFTSQNDERGKGALMRRGRTVLVTGSCGLIGSVVTRWFARLGFCTTGIDSNHRSVFFGTKGDTSWVLGPKEAVG